MIYAPQNSNSAASLYDSLNARNSGVGAANGQNSASAVQDRFLKLLVTQMKNQDPLNPMDNAQVTSQMAQLSTVSGIDKLNASVQALGSSMAATQSMSAIGMIGHGVLVRGDVLQLSGAQAGGGINLPQPVDGVEMTIKDVSGRVVRTLNLGAQQAGVLPFVWDGKDDAGNPVANGVYQMSARASVGTSSFTAETLSYGTVNAVTQGAQGARLEVGILGSFALTDIVQYM
jgi:flagellar basal-body rod modification protein FlgD